MTTKNFGARNMGQEESWKAKSWDERTESQRQVQRGTLRKNRILDLKIFQRRWRGIFGYALGAARQVRSFGKQRENHLPLFVSKKKGLGKKAFFEFLYPICAVGVVSQATWKRDETRRGERRDETRDERRDETRDERRDETRDETRRDETTGAQSLQKFIF